MSDTSDTGSFRFQPLIELSPEDANYLEASARLRGISKTRLVGRLIRIISQDQLVLSILDDDSKVCRRAPGERALGRPRRLPENA